MKTYTRKRLVHQEIKDVLDLCRLCLNKPEPEEEIPIFKDSKDVCAVVAMRIMICVGLEIAYEDSLPNKICKTCCEQLEMYYKFRRKCEISYHKLKSHSLALKEKENVTLNHEVCIHNNVITKIPLDDDIKDLLEGKQSEQDIEVVKPEKEDLIEEVHIPIQTENTPDISTFLTTVLKELGVLVSQESGLLVAQAGTFELEVNDDQMMVELVEETDDDEQQKPLLRPVSELKCNIVNEIIHTNAKKKGGAWCGECGRVFSSGSAARRHARVHAAARPHACTHCRRTFTQRSTRDRHMRVHLSQRPYKCPSCPKSFTQRGALESHSASHAASSTRPLALHACTQCDKLFLHTSGLSRHMLTHTGTSFECFSCKRCFNDKSSLLRHMKNTHPGTLVRT